MKRVREEIHQIYYRTCPDLAPHHTLFCLLEKHRLGRAANQFMKPRKEDWDGIDDDVFGNNHEYSTYIPHLRPGRKFLAGPGSCMPLLLSQCWRCKKIKEGIEEDYCGSRQCAYYHYSTSTCRACTQYRTCAVCARKRCLCRFAKCCVEDCPNLMCRCQLFGECDLGENEQVPEGEHAISCAFVLDPDDGDSDSSAEQKQYCQEHKSDGAVPGIP
jgi:hypothetical protein